MTERDLSEVEAPQLFLADERGPVMREGAPAESLEGPPPASVETEELRLYDPGGDPNDLRIQRWGIVHSQAGRWEDVLEAISPLVALRRDEQRGEPLRFEVPPGQDALAASRWVLENIRELPNGRRPRYLLVLGDLPDVSAELQHVLAAHAFVGRLHCGKPDGGVDLDGYRGYADKVVAAERRRASAPERPDASVYVVHDGSRATTAAIEHLIAASLPQRDGWTRPDLDELRESPLVGRAAEILVDRPGRDDLLAAAASGGPPCALLTVGHGFGPRRAEWSERRAHQGDLLFATGERLDAAQLQRRPFVPDGLWFHFACFGGGTPAHSTFYPWLRQLAALEAYSEPVEAVLACLASADDPTRGPFLAAAPQAALAHPQGPQAVVAHMDLVWSYSFLGEERGRACPQRIMNVLYQALRGRRVGIAADVLVQAYREADNRLTSMLQAREDALAFGRKDPIGPVALARAWMLRNDLRGYLLFGDPAARLPVSD